MASPNRPSDFISATMSSGMASSSATRASFGMSRSRTNRWIVPMNSSKASLSIGMQDSELAASKPPFAALVGLEVFERAAGFTLADAQIELTDVLVGNDFVTRAFEHDFSELHDIGEIGVLQGEARVLLHEQNRNFLLTVDLGDDREHLLH